MNTLPNAPHVVFSKRLYINSTNRTSGIASNFNITQPNFLTIQDPDLKIRVSVLKCVIPYSFYAVVGGVNNTLTIRESDDDGVTNVNEFTIIFTEGNYNVIQLKIEFKRLLDLSPSTFTYDIDFNYVSHKLTITMTDVGKQSIFKFSPDTSIHESFGFDHADYTLTSTLPLTSPNIINLSGIRSVFIKTNLVNDGSIDQSTGKNSRTLISIPINVPHYNLLVYEKLNEYDDMFITNRNIHDFHIELTTEGGDHLLLNGQEWDIVLIFDVVRIR